MKYKVLDVKRPELCVTVLIAILIVQLSSQVIASIPIVETSITELPVKVKGYGMFNVTVVKIDIYKAGIHYIAFNASCKIGSSVVRLEAPPYPISVLYTTSPLVAIAYSIPPDYKYNWDGIVFVKNPGPPEVYVKYDHPDYYETYNIEVNDDKTLQGYSKFHTHIAKYHIEDAKQNNDLYALLASVIQFILALLAVPAVGWIAAAIAAVIVAALVIVNRAIYYFLNDILQDERGGGWMWTWGFSGWFIFRWFWISFGAWRDWGWFVFFLTHGGGGLWCRMR